MQVIKFKSVKILAPYLFLLLIFGFVFTAEFLSYRPDYIYKCERVIDGDTIVVSRSGYSLKVRFAYIDAPESSQRSFDKIPIGKNSTKFLRNLIEGKKVKLEILKKDLYGRTIGVVYLNNQSVNKLMVERGHAIYYDQRTLPEIRLSEYRAKMKRLGIWKTDGFYNPKSFRKMK
jgi:micrococcal nuclease